MNGVYVTDDFGSLDVVRPWILISASAAQNR
jgi:hypothetical protein